MEFVISGNMEHWKMFVSVKSEDCILAMAYNMMELGVESGKFEFVNRNGDPYAFPAPINPEPPVCNISINGHYPDVSTSRSILSRSPVNESESESGSSQRRSIGNKNHNNKNSI